LEARQQVTAHGCFRRSPTGGRHFFQFERGLPGDAGLSTAIILDHPGCDAYDKGFYIVFLEEDGTAFDTIGPFDTEADAKQILEDPASYDDLCQKDSAQRLA
jgi:hypothetical protein